MKKRESYRQHPQFPNIGVHSDPAYPSYMTIGGSGVVGTFGAESPMSEMQGYENSESPTQEAAEGASMNSGSGAAAGAGVTGAGSGVA